LELLSGKTIGLDGSFFRASASDASITTKKRLAKKCQRIERDLEAYTQAIEAHDEQENQAGDRLGEEPALTAKIKQLKASQAHRKAQLKQLEERGETQLSRTDPDARSLAKHKQPVTGYNVQQCVDSRHKLIVHHEVTNAGNDSQQLSRQSWAAKGTPGCRGPDRRRRCRLLRCRGVSHL